MGGGGTEAQQADSSANQGGADLSNGRLPSRRAKSQVGHRATAEIRALHACVAGSIINGLPRWLPENPKDWRRHLTVPEVKRGFQFSAVGASKSHCFLTPVPRCPNAMTTISSGLEWKSEGTRDGAAGESPG